MSVKKPKPTVALLRSGNRLVVDPTTPKIKDLLTPHLRYVEKKFAQGEERTKRKRAHLPLFDEIEWECYSEDHKGRLATSFGFQDRLKNLLESKGYPVVCKYASKVEAEKAAERLKTVYKARWDRIDELVKSGFEFRHKQKRAVKIADLFENGRIDCPPGWGKGTIIMLIATLFPKAKIAVVTKNIPVLTQRLYPELCANLPSVGIVGGGKRVKGRRVMCYSADSLHHAKGDEDIVLVDEGHQACSDNFAHKMGVFDHARIYMFSASWDMRLDNKDMRAEAMAGPIRLTVTYQEAVEHDMVVPIEVFWTDVVMDENPCSEMDGTRKKRYGIWTNEYRNKLIARDARLYDDDTQVLITVETLEHALYLKKLLPEFEVVYSGQGLKDTDIIWYQNHFPDEFTQMTEERKQKITRRFEKGKLKKAIATTVWNVGVNFRNLEVLIRADAGGSPINDTQIPGRTSRVNSELVKKTGTQEKMVGILHDYRDMFDTGFKYKFQSREKSYTRNQWRQHYPKEEKKSLLRRMMKFGSLV